MLHGIFKKQTNIKAIGAVVVLVMALIAIPVFLTGEPAEEAVEHLQGISKSMIHDHEEAAEQALWVMEAAGIFALISLILQFKKSKIVNIFFVITLIVACLSFALMAFAGYLGGQIRHTEIANTISLTVPGALQPKAEQEAGDDD
ncbi:MAG: hypothetical protein IT257_00475 [Chitinophagaceae bacterium]|nr:hypothetical protein [Chitinophagaceae bacterium]